MNNVRCFSISGCSFQDWHDCISDKLLAALETFISPSLTHLPIGHLRLVPFTVFAFPQLQYMALTSITSAPEHTIIPDHFPRHGLCSLICHSCDLREVTENTSLVTFLAHTTRQLESLEFKGALEAREDMFDLFISLYEHALKVFDISSLLCRPSSTMHATVSLNMNIVYPEERLEVRDLSQFASIRTFEMTFRRPLYKGRENILFLLGWLAATIMHFPSEQPLRQLVFDIFDAGTRPSFETPDLWSSLDEAVSTRGQIKMVFVRPTGHCCLP